MHRIKIGTSLVSVCSPVRRTNMFENTDLCRTNWENAILMHSHAIVPDIRSSGEPENIQATNYR